MDLEKIVAGVIVAGGIGVVSLSFLTIYLMHKSNKYKDSPEGRYQYWAKKFKEVKEKELTREMYNDLCSASVSKDDKKFKELMKNLDVELPDKRYSELSYFFRPPYKPLYNLSTNSSNKDTSTFWLSATF